MAETERIGLMQRMSDLIGDFPAAAVTGPLTGKAQSAAERRAVLALRIALLQRGDAALPLPLPLPEPEQPEILVPEPAPAPPPEPEIAPPPPAKPARITMSTLRLEDAAMLLAAASAPPEPPPAAAATFEPTKPKRGKSFGVADFGSDFAALSAFEEPAAEDEPTAGDFTAEEAVFDAPAPTQAAEDEAIQPDPPKAKSKRRSGSVSATDGLASAAAALAAFQMPDFDAPDPAEETAPEG
jgi:hypothetical protein